MLGTETGAVMNEILGGLGDWGRLVCVLTAERRVWESCFVGTQGPTGPGVQAKKLGKRERGAREKAEQLLLQRTGLSCQHPRSSSQPPISPVPGDPVPEGLCTGANRFCPFSFPPLLNL